MEKVYEALDAITKRIGNPFLISFALAWLAANWKAVLVAMSQDHYSWKILYYESVLYAPETEPRYRLVWYPLAAAVTYVFVIPLLSTVATVVGGLYDNLNEWAKARVLNLRLLTIKQSQALQAQMEAIFNKLTEENEALLTARIDSTRRAGATAVAVLQATAPLILAGMRTEAVQWRPPISKMPPGREVGSNEQNAFAREFGIPELWLKVFEPGLNTYSFTLQRAAKLYETSENEALAVLIKMVAIGLLQAQWVDDQYRFDLAGSSWGNLLNGRPA